MDEVFKANSSWKVLLGISRSTKACQIRAITIVRIEAGLFARRGVLDQLEYSFVYELSHTACDFHTVTIKLFFLNYIRQQIQFSALTKSISNSNSSSSLFVSHIKKILLLRGFGLVERGRPGGYVNEIASSTRRYHAILAIIPLWPQMIVHFHFFINFISSLKSVGLSDS